MTIKQFFEENPKVAVAFSGGVDSAYLLYAAVRYGKEIKAYYVKTPFQPQFEQEDAMHLAEELKAEMKILEVDVLRCREVRDNPPDRCYYCKRLLFQNIAEAAKADGFPLLVDGTNASDDASDRPGMRALRELQVRSPLRECGLTKKIIRQQSREAGLFTWNKPAYACLATRITTGESITEEKLARTEMAENYLMGLGFRDFRVRSSGDTAKIQILERDFHKVAAQRAEIVGELRRYYKNVLLDLEERHEQ